MRPYIIVCVHHIGQENDGMKVVGHDDEFVQEDTRADDGCFHSFIKHDVTIIVKNHLVFDDSSKYHVALKRA